MMMRWIKQTVRAVLRMVTALVLFQAVAPGEALAEAAGALAWFTHTGKLAIQHILNPLVPEFYFKF
jgi:hypothetical protein